MTPLRDHQILLPSSSGGPPLPSFYSGKSKTRYLLPISLFHMSHLSKLKRYGLREDIAVMQAEVRRRRITLAKQGSTSNWDPVEATVDFFYIYILPNTRY
jgi:hypothetical protein